jgi:alkylhydroperoxidase family enzyme
VSWLGATEADVLARREPLAGRVRALRDEARSRAPGRTADLVTARVASLVQGTGSLEPFGELTEGERAVVALAEQFLVDAHGIDDAMVAALSPHYTPDEQLAILFHLTLADGFTKFAHVAGVPAARPEEAP